VSTFGLSLVSALASALGLSLAIIIYDAFVICVYVWSFTLIVCVHRLRSSFTIIVYEHACECASPTKTSCAAVIAKSDSTMQWCCCCLIAAISPLAVAVAVLRLSAQRSFALVAFLDLLLASNNNGVPTNMVICCH